MGGSSSPKTRTIHIFFPNPRLPRIEFSIGSLKFNPQCHVFIFYAHPAIYPIEINIEFNAGSHRKEVRAFCQQDCLSILPIPLCLKPPFTDLLIKLDIKTE